MGKHRTEDIVDEVCTCGHLKSHHCDRFGQNHGACRSTDCDCKQYTWRCFLFNDALPMANDDGWLV